MSRPSASRKPWARGDGPEVSLPDAEAKILKPQNLVEMLALGSRDLGFAGADWVRARGECGRAPRPRRGVVIH